jgi:phosphoribosylformimino-5-aminoimidazole carboxamide ribotide isomerase
MIILPAIDLRRGQCVRLEQGQAERETVYSRDPAATARRWAAQGAEWLHVVNLDGALEPSQRSPGFGEGAAKPACTAINLQRLVEIHRAAPDLFIQFGGGVRSLVDIEILLERGASRVVLGTVAVENPVLVSRAVHRFGPERIAVAVDTRDGRVATRGWRQTSHVTAVSLGQQMRQRGVVRVVYTDISRDGMLAGVNVEATAALARATGLRVIASGGVASLADLTRLSAHRDEIEGVIIGQALYKGVISLSDAIRAVGPAQSPGETELFS